MNDLAQHDALLLGLNEDWLVIDVNLQLEQQRVEISLKHNPDIKCDCPECGTPRPLKDHTPERTWRHLNTMQFETVITARTPRTNCPDCGVHTVHIPWAEPHGRFTLLFEAFAIEVLRAASSVKQACELLGIGWDAAHTIMERAVERGCARRDLDDIEHVGIDEKNFGKGHSYVSVMTEIDASRVLEVVPGRKKESTDSLWNTLSEKQKKSVKGVAMDMWPAYASSTEEHVPEAKIVHDRFHIAKHLNEAVDRVRRAEHKALKQEGDERLKGSRYLWLTNEENLSEERAASFEALKKAKLKTARAWAIREQFLDFHAQRNESAGRRIFKKWYSWASRCRMEPMKRVGEMIKEHFERIVTWFSHPISNGSSEGFNSKIQALKTAARGFRNFRNYRTRILFFCGKLELLPEPVT